MEAKDLIAIIVLIGTFVLIALDKISWEVAVPVISAITFLYLGIKVGERTARKGKSG